MAMRVICHVERRNPGEAPYWQRYEVSLEEGTTVLGLLSCISREEWGLAFPLHHCKTGICGGCRLLVNGRQQLACRTFVDSAEIRLQPPPGFPNIKDLVVDSLSALPERSGARRK